MAQTAHLQPHPMDIGTKEPFFANAPMTTKREKKRILET
jgi:hypothetical protein